MNAPTILTGDRPTGPLHLGHFVGSLRQRVALQHTHNQLPRRGHRPEPDHDLPAVCPARPRRADDAVYEHRHRCPRGA